MFVLNIKHLHNGQFLEQQFLRQSVVRIIIVSNIIELIGTLSNLLVFSTQALLYAVGLGSGSIPLAAGLNWVIKDGLGQLGGVLFARSNIQYNT